jgi:hypothetical protein
LYKNFGTYALKSISIIRLEETKCSRQKETTIKSVSAVYDTETQHDDLNQGGGQFKLIIKNIT